MTLLRGCAFVFWGLLLPAMAAADAGERCPAAGTAARMPHASLDLRLAATSSLPASARRSLVSEVEQIWCREGVRVRWSAGEAAAGRPDRGLQVLVIPWAVSAAASREHAWPVGELLPGTAGQSIALASTTAAQRVVTATGRPHEPAALADHRLGVILGRAVAHEIGHYLLGRGHAPHGLMRAHIPANEFADLRAGGFYLEGPVTARIREAVNLASATGARLPILPN